MPMCLVPEVKQAGLGRCFRGSIRMSRSESEMDSAHLRELAAKCRRLAEAAYDREIAAAFRRMGSDYDRLAHNKEQQQIPPPRNLA